jgi:glycosyltransferase involved in cell wall biosynthesis
LDLSSINIQFYFSVIIPVYNREQFLDRALDSLMTQTFTDFETIVVDDASSDNSYEMALKHPLPNKKVLRNEVNSERCITRNRGVEAAKGKYICFLDSDDYHLPEHLQKLYDFIQEKGEPEAFFFTNAWDETADGISSERHCPDFESTDPYTYFLRYTVNPQRWCVHKNIMQNHRFDPAITICEDMDTSLRMVAAGVPVFQLKERTTVYVAAPDSFTHGAQDKWERELANLEKIFSKSELRVRLPRSEKNRLRSMCHYHLAIKAFNQGQGWAVLGLGIKSFLLYPRGYNGRTNKSLAVMLLYSVPFLGDVLKKVIRLVKK